MIKLDVISGFLGAGKTTVIKKLLASSLKNEKVVLIENEFGEIGIDGSFLKESGIEIKEINAGCICCSLVGDFSTSLKEVVDKFNPDRIIIEPSGVGKLSDIVNAVTKVDAPLSINILCTVVDGAKAKIQLRNFGEFFTNQVAAASSIIVSKVDKITEEKLAEAVSIIKEIAENASVITTSLDEIDPEKLLEFLESKVSLNHFIEEVEDEEECDDPDCECHHHHHHHDEDEDEDKECHHHHHHHHDEDEECDDEECECHHHDEEGHEHHHHHHHHHHADEVFVSWGIETVKKVSNEQLTSFLETLKNDESLGMILRSKGILKASDNDKWYYFDFVSGDYEIRLGEADYTGKLVVIGHDIKEEKIEELFNNL
ncbi:MAG: GTP-binding protein [Gammaproteobacteria bacterium]|nr:GTP-binding protein [Gammaproteobacteria bacterium]